LVDLDETDSYFVKRILESGKAQWMVDYFYTGYETYVVVLNSANSFLKFQVIKSWVRICEDKERKSRGFEARAIMEYFDFLHIRNRLERGEDELVNPKDA